MTLDENVQAVREARQKLIRRHGGLGGWIRHLMAMDQARIRREKTQRRKKRPGKPRVRVVSQARG
jgi:hypothetical protein